MAAVGFTLLLDFLNKDAQALRIKNPCVGGSISRANKNSVKQNANLCRLALSLSFLDFVVLVSGPCLVLETTALFGEVSTESPNCPHPSHSSSRPYREHGHSSVNTNSPSKMAPQTSENNVVLPPGLLAPPR